MDKITPKTDRLGVLKLGEFFARVGWLFREQLVHDHGIDAQVEITDGETPVGALIGIQVKSGRSYFAEQTGTSIIFRATDKHVKYWIRHLLPVIVVLYDDGQDILYWEAVSKQTTKRMGKTWRIDIPKENVLSSKSLAKLRALTQPPQDIRQFNKLRLDRAWMELVAEGEVVYVEFEDWVNKSLPRYAVTIGCETRNDIPSRKWPTTYAPGMSFQDFLSKLLPWANFKMDEEAYDNFMEDQWMTECYGWHDKETGKTYYTMPFSEYYTPPEGIMPVSDNGETQGYRLILELNELGKAFLVLDDYLNDEDDLEQKTFTLF